MTKDGALSLNEFCTAMHLVVLRVRNFELPKELPPQLQPHSPLISLNSETTSSQPSNFINLIKNEKSDSSNFNEESMVSVFSLSLSLNMFFLKI